MTLAALMVVGPILLVAAALAALAWFAQDQAEDEWRSFSRFEGMALEG